MRRIAAHSSHSQGTPRVCLTDVHNSPNTGASVLAITTQAGLPTANTDPSELAHILAQLVAASAPENPTVVRSGCAATPAGTSS